MSTHNPRRSGIRLPEEKASDAQRNPAPIRPIAPIKPIAPIPPLQRPQPARPVASTIARPVAPVQGTRISPIAPIKPIAPITPVARPAITPVSPAPHTPAASAPSVSAPTLPDPPAPQQAQETQRRRGTGAPAPQSSSKMSANAWQQRRGAQAPAVAPIAPIAPLAPVVSYDPDNRLILDKAKTIVPSPVDSGMMEKINGYQAKYVAFAGGDANAVVPVSMWNGTVLALSTLQDRHGDVVPFLLAELGWSQEHLESALSPEQADAVALIIANAKEKARDSREFMLCDEAGFGKGRILMTVAAWQIKNDIIPIIMTDSAHLFSNLWQDVIDIGETETLKRFFILNESTPIEDISTQAGGAIFPNISPKLLKDTIATGTTLPEGYGCVALTYSQINAKAEKSKKYTFLHRLATHNKVAFVKDEGHNAVTYSANTSTNVSLLKELAYSSVDASATSSRHVMNMATYNSIYPWLADRQFDLSIVSDHRQLWLSEMSVVKAVGAGQTIRRELDSTGIAIELVEPSREMAEKHGEIHNQTSLILHQLLKISNRVKAVCDGYNARNMDKKESNDYVAVPFGMRRAIIANQLEACLNVPLAVKEAVACLKRGEKPFLTLDMTMESAVAAVRSESGSTDSEDDDQIDVTPEKPFSIKDLMRITLDRCMEYKHKGDKHTFTDETLALFEQKLEITGHAPRAYAEVMAMIDALPEMPASPIDAIRDGIEAEGARLYAAGALSKPWRVGEASGRKRAFSDGVFTAITKTKNAAISDFNFGVTDGLIATTAIAVGATAHNCAKFSDQRTRTQIEVVSCRDPIKRTQMWGRTNRRGNLTTPLYRTLTTGTPNSLCNIALQNAKCKHLRASVSGSMESNMLIDVLDVLSTEGNRIARKFLIRNPHIAALCNSDGLTGGDEDFQHVKRLFHASPLMSTDLMNRMMHFFHEEIAQAKARGIIFDVSSLGDNWSWSDEESIIAPFPDGLSARRIERPAVFSGKPSSALPPLEKKSGVIVNAIDSIASQDKRYAHLARYLPHYLKSVKMAFAAAKKSEHEGVRRNPVILEDERCDRMGAILEELRVGACYILPDRYQEKRPAMITGVRAPEDPFDFDSYEVSYLVPGDQEEYTLTLEDMERMNSTHISDRETVKMRFDRSAVGQGAYTEKRWILQGNPLDCVLLSDMMKVGQKMTFNLSDGSDVVGILVSDYEMQRDILNAPIPVPDIKAAKTLMQNGVPLCFSRGAEQVISVRKRIDSYFIQFVGSDNAKMSAIGTLKRASEEVKARNPFNITCPPDKLDMLLTMIGQKFKLYAPADSRRVICDLYRDREQEVAQETSLNKVQPQMTLNL